MREPAEVYTHLMVMTACSRRSQWARERRRAKGIVRTRFSQFQCAHLCDVFIGDVFPDVVFVPSARAHDTLCTGFDFTLWLKKNIHSAHGSGAWLVHIAMAELTAQQVQELVRRITGPEQMNQQLQTLQTTAQNTVALLSQQLNHAQQGSTQGVARPREGMTDRKAFSTLPPYTGKVEDFDDRHFKMKEEELGHYDQQEGLAVNTEWLNQQLFRVLSLNLDGPALAVVKDLAEEAKTGLRSPRITWVPRVSEWLAW